MKRERMMLGVERISLEDDRDFLVWREGSGGTTEIVYIQVGSERRQGKGRRLLEVLFAGVRKDRLVWAITRASNLIAQQFYEQTGFKVIGVLRGFHGSDSIDAVMYGRMPEGPV